VAPPDGQNHAQTSHRHDPRVRTRDLGFTLDDIVGLLALAGGGPRTAATPFVTSPRQTSTPSPANRPPIVIWDALQPLAKLPAIAPYLRPPVLVSVALASTVASVAIATAGRPDAPHGGG
jgi:hypothetical protein